MKITSSNSRTVVITGGETGGHLFPALTLARYFRKRWPDCKVLYVGAKKGRMESEAAFRGDMFAYGLNMRPFCRDSLMKNLLLPFCILHAAAQSRIILRKCKPDVVVGVGGYASGPFVLAASLMNIPTVLLEPNAVPGVTNRLLKNRSDRICVAFSRTAGYFPEKKSVTTGAPVRENIAKSKASKEEALRFFGFDGQDAPTILATGGSLGTPAINRAVSKNLPALLASGLRILWQTGNDHWKSIAKVAKIQNPERIRIFPFIDRMDLAYAISDLVVSAAGAVTLAELALLGKPSILIPSPEATERHQHKNASAVFEGKGCVLIDPDRAENELARQIAGTVGNREKLRKLERGIRRFARPEATRRIFEIVSDLGKAGRK